MLNNHPTGTSQTYYIWTIGCQMNKSETDKIAGFSESMGYYRTDNWHDANLVILNTCMVRQHAENKVLGKLNELKQASKHKPYIAVTGCFVNSNVDKLKQKYPHIDLFFEPGRYDELADKVNINNRSHEPYERLFFPKNVSHVAFLTSMQGCDNFCSYCIVPYRRGRQRSRPIRDVLDEAERLISSGAKEIILLGQNIDGYGKDLTDKTSLACLLNEMNLIPGLKRIRFLTSHPRDMTPELISRIASLDKVCEDISLPIQSGNNEILKAMNRGYNVEEYVDIVNLIRRKIPEASLNTDIIVGFPGETDAQFEDTLDILRKIKFDNIHVAAYSPRPQTLAARELKDDIPLQTKKKRLSILEEAQTEISLSINSALIGSKLEILVEDKKKGKWFGRTRSNKLVFFTEESSMRGEIVTVLIENAGPRSLRGKLGK